MAKKRSQALIKAKKLMDSLMDSAMNNPDIDFREKRGLLDTMLKFYQLEEKFKEDTDEAGLSELQRKLHSDLGGGA